MDISGYQGVELPLEQHQAEDAPAFGGSIIVRVCAVCRRPDGGRVGMPCPAVLIARAEGRTE